MPVLSARLVSRRFASKGGVALRVVDGGSALGIGSRRYWPRIDDADVRYRQRRRAGGDRCRHRRSDQPRNAPWGILLLLPIAPLLTMCGKQSSF